VYGLIVGCILFIGIILQSAVVIVLYRFPYRSNDLLFYSMNDGLPPIEAAAAAATTIVAATDATTRSTTIQEADKRETEWWMAFAESCVRVSMAAFAGSVVGLAKERQQDAGVEPPPPPPSPGSEQKYSKSTMQQQQQQQQHRGINHRRYSKARPRGPPRAAARRAAPLANLPAAWAVSCGLFGLILESCRRASPTSAVFAIMDAAAEEEGGGGAPKGADTCSILDVPSPPPPPPPRTFHDKVVRQSLISVGDYALGGTVAGLAGALGKEQRRHFAQAASKTPVTLFGLTTGLGLGLVAGAVQAANDIANLYYLEGKANEQDGLLAEVDEHNAEDAVENTER
jgi:hypothetical protein